MLRWQRLRIGGVRVDEPRRLPRYLRRLDDLFHLMPVGCSPGTDKRLRRRLICTCGLLCSARSIWACRFRINHGLSLILRRLRLLRRHLLSQLGRRYDTCALLHNYWLRGCRLRVISHRWKQRCHPH